MLPALRLALALALTLLVVLPAVAEPLVPEQTPSPLPQNGVPTLDQLRPPEVRARAAILVDAESGAVLYEKNAYQRLSVASLTKMVTALVALERGQLSQPIRATEYSRSVPSVIGLDPGDVLTLEQMLYGLMLNSGNDAALAIAENLGEGSGQEAIESFVGLMNDKVRKMGLEHTRFANPNGLDSPGHNSTAYEMAQIAIAYMANPILAKIASTKRYEIQGPPLWVFSNINGLLWSLPSADGVKTGYEDSAGRCLAGSASRDGHRLIAVVLDSPDYVGETARLLDYGFANRAWLVLNARTNPLLGPAYLGGERRIAPASRPELVFPPERLEVLQTLERLRRLEQTISRHLHLRSFITSSSH